jgi:glucose/arabinose dehydrogenase
MNHKISIALTFLILAIIGSALLFNQLINQSRTKTALQYEVKDAFPNLSFDHPDGVCSSGDGTSRLFVVGQMGIIYVFENRRNATEANIFLDIRDRVHSGAFLGLTFDPNFTDNGYFYVNYVADNPLRTIISQWSVLSKTPDAANITSQKILLEIPRLSESHAGGQLAFGPDGYLYIALGDGNPYGDLTGNAQNLSSLQGKILRIDIDNPSSGRNYGIPKDNPFNGNASGLKEEIFTYGFRNPWRFSFDSTNGKLWVGDVGQDRMEEIDIVEKGKNYGWNLMEGTLPYANGNLTGLEPPIWTYRRDVGNATIGGYVYHGTRLSELTGSYIYGDYVSGRIWSLNIHDINNPTNKELVKTNLNITSFGIGQNKELYICAQDGKIYELEKA